jgi:hypothetical protein
MAQHTDGTGALSAVGAGNRSDHRQGSLLAEYLKHESADSTCTRLHIAGGSVDVHFSHRSILELFRPAIRHLEAAPEGSADFQIFCFTGGRKLREWLEEHNLPLQANRTAEVASIRYCYQGHTLFALETDTGSAFYWAEEEEAFSYYRAKPFTRILSWYASRRGLSWLHAACVGTPRGAVLLPGPAGSGKSTIFAACLLSGFFCLGDDFNLLDAEGLVAHGMYANIMLSAHSIELLKRFPGADRLAGAFHEKQGKECCPVASSFPLQLQRSLPLKGILIPEITSSRSAITAAGSDEAMESLVSSVQITWLLGSPVHAMLRDFRSTTQRLRCGRLHIGRDLELIPKLVSEFIDDE